MHGIQFIKHALLVKVFNRLILVCNFAGH